jgi:hypothetical protein
LGNDVELFEFEAECHGLFAEGSEVVLVGFANLLD